MASSPSKIPADCRNGVFRISVVYHNADSASTQFQLRLEICLLPGRRLVDAARVRGDWFCQKQHPAATRQCQIGQSHPPLRRRFESDRSRPLLWGPVPRKVSGGLRYVRNGLCQPSSASPNRSSQLGGGPASNSNCLAKARCRHHGTEWVESSFQTGSAAARWERLELNKSPP